MVSEVYEITLMGDEDTLPVAVETYEEAGWIKHGSPYVDMSEYGDVMTMQRMRLIRHEAPERMQ